jgi:flavodoxin
MKNAIANFAAAALFVAAASVPAMGANRTLVVFYSFTGNTESIVGSITNAISADVVEVHPAEEGLDYAANNYAIGSQLIAGIRANPDSAESYPAIQETAVDFSRYDNVIVATPLWWSNMAAPMQTFLFQHGAEMAGKNVALVVSSASSGISGVVGDAKRLVPDGVFGSANLWINNSNRANAAQLVADWVAGLDFPEAPADPVVPVIGGAQVVWGASESGGDRFEIAVSNAEEAVWYTAFATGSLPGEWRSVRSEQATSDGELAMFLSIPTNATAWFVRLVASSAEIADGTLLP